MTERTAPTAPRLDALMARFLARKSNAPDVDEGTASEVEPHEVIGGFRAETRTTWAEAVAAFKLLGLSAERLPTPPEWPAFAALPPSGHAVPLAAGLFPQRVRDFGPLLGDAVTRPSATDVVPGFSGLRAWVAKNVNGSNVAATLVAAGVAAGLGDLDTALSALDAIESRCDGSWQAAWANQRAAVLWLAGRRDEAVATWDRLPETPAVAFNRGMARLALGRPADAVPHLGSAAETLPDDSGWTHLARLYYSLAALAG